MKKVIKKKYVSLIEILVVVAIIGILASLLLPSLGKARKRSQATVCGSNLKQMGVVFHMYTYDNKGLMMYATNGLHGTSYRTWSNSGETFGAYLNNLHVHSSHDLLWCPSDPYAEAYASSNSHKREPSYGYNTGNLASKQLNSVATPSETVAFADSGHKVEDNYWSWLLSTGGDRNIYWERHDNNGANILWLDGHVTFYRPTKVQSINGDTSLWDDRVPLFL
ncbi:prepilin-type N-terminal cleavage/methylation domain-containing protein [Lentisphaera marina]|uniref:prepilin-type N-terminal cleavage/methylation domain-containing protein n=1 Tax=Lentisphaera marina TaxID=1111041 RepID=UPI00236502D9|nr:prepilin-type N-terminal cleavage/methylation domain-containing protein [Lentisphaera marina]MDD7985125.1 prepilin-type N-terminal cleavage/methylation domain-containing protein [Lentisphaera marina]